MVVEAPDVTSPAVVAAGAAFERAALATGEMNQPITFVVNPARTAASTGPTRSAAPFTPPVIWNCSSAARPAGEIRFEFAGLSGERIWVTRPVAWIRAITSLIAAW